MAVTEMLLEKPDRLLFTNGFATQKVIMFAIFASAMMAKYRAPSRITIQSRGEDDLDDWCMYISRYDFRAVRRNATLSKMNNPIHAAANRSPESCVKPRWHPVIVSAGVLSVPNIAHTATPIPQMIIAIISARMRLLHSYRAYTLIVSKLPTRT